MTGTEWENSAGACVFHTLQLRKGINVDDHLRRLKLRIFELEDLLGYSAKDKKDIMSTEEAFWIMYNKLPFGVFSGTRFAKRCIRLIGRNDMHKDSILRKLRRFRYIGRINCPNIEFRSKSLYMKSPMVG